MFILKSSNMKRIAIIGSSGFYGRAVIRDLRTHYPKASILGLDVVKPVDSQPDEFRMVDVRDPQLLSHLQQFDPDTVLHLAFIVNPSRNEKFEEDVNVNGTKNVLRAVAELQPERFLVSSSGTAYGAWPDNPLPIREDWPIRARVNFPYARHKAEIEQYLTEFAESHPEMAVSWTRPTVIVGPGMSNYLTDLLVHSPVMSVPVFKDPPIQLVDLDEVAQATRTILEHNGRGPFNLAPNDWMTFREVARVTGRFPLVVWMPLAKGFSYVWWKLRLPIFRFPPAFWDFLCHPWVIEPHRLQEEFGFTFQISTRECLDGLLKSRNANQNVPAIAEILTAPASESDSEPYPPRTKALHASGRRVGS